MRLPVTPIYKAMYQEIQLLYCVSVLIESMRRGNINPISILRYVGDGAMNMQFKLHGTLFPSQEAFPMSKRGSGFTLERR